MLHTTTNIQMNSPATQQQQTTCVSDASGATVAVKKVVERCTATDCRAKLMLTDSACRCGTRFCSKHRHFENHGCTYDYKGAAQTQLKTNLVKCVASQIERI
jgi:predicted nucleic acid binding AN1-type Zn finger protein